MFGNKVCVTRQFVNKAWCITIGVRAGGGGGSEAPPPRVSEIFGQNAQNSGNKEANIND